MANIDNLDSIKKIDRDNMLQNTQDFPLQIEECWRDWKKIALPTHFINVKNVLILGMGGSGLGGGIIQNFADLMSMIPVTVMRDYDIPLWVDKTTLVIAVSYSGSTEETLEALKQAGQKSDKIITISTGGALASLGSQFRAVHYKINYGAQPRAALGYSLTSLMAIFSKLKFLEITDDHMSEAILLLQGLRKKIDADIPTSHNPAKLLANRLEGHIPIILSSGSLSEVGRRWKTHFNENAKNASYSEIIPEMNHNSLVGLEYPKNLSNNIFVIILESKYDHPRTKLRQKIAGQIMVKRQIPYESIMMQPTGNIYAETLQMILFGDFVAFYLAIINNTDPNPVEIIKFLKDKLAESPFEGRGRG